MGPGAVAKVIIEGLKDVLDEIMVQERYGTFDHPSPENRMVGRTRRGK